MNNLTDLLTHWPTNQASNSLQAHPRERHRDVMNKSGETFRQSEKHFLWELPVSFISVIAAHTQTKQLHTQRRRRRCWLCIAGLFISSLIEQLCLPQIGWPFQILPRSLLSRSDGERDATTLYSDCYRMRKKQAVIYVCVCVCHCLYTLALPPFVQLKPHLHIVCMQLHLSGALSASIWLCLGTECDSLWCVCVCGKDNLWERATNHARCVNMCVYFCVCGAIHGQFVCV